MSSRKEEPAQGGSNDFVKKLFQMLSEDKYMSVVRWTASGNSFVVLDTNEFTKEILPRHFKHSNFASFVRQLNKYDFHKVKISNEEKQHYEYGDDAWEFQHPEFRKDDINALENIRRKAPTKKEPAYDANPHYDSQIAQIRSELAQLRDENKSMGNKYKGLLNNVATLRTFNERQYHSIGILLNALNEAGIKIPPLDLPNPNVMNMASPAGAGPQPTQASPQQPPSERAVKVKQEPQQSVSHSRSGSGSVPEYDYNSSGRQGPSSNRGSHSSHPSMNHVNHTRHPSSTSPLGGDVVGPVSTVSVPNPKFHVLLVEDDNVCIQLCRKFLMKYGCQVTVVTDGLNAISTVKQTIFDLVLMDIVMPNLDGASATNIIRSFDTRTPIIAMTANIQDADLVNYLQNGMSDILAKPFSKDDLYAILTKHLMSASKAAEYENDSTEIHTIPMDSNASGVDQQLGIDQPVNMGQHMPSQNLSEDPMGQPIMDSMEAVDQPAKKQRTH
ncbi:hypothetical protein FT663_04678 [Candidozyma haemuli var. vulneris]|uniref:Transcription factor n=1 Tax=Candidozyma haemuli TaxID=45357 RepID=A0A2V1AZA5_9ASCO|nr:hypothetical protein CXQ85_002947 [[Candida] haemuloni]KAF3986911.1 hypothetical protein FT663_04678 [[Candida] haemuloni var. vulneris]KAF3991379.1 hypothetical protein FT662_01734 [[Candida] haemuloni var. vulneris]PVH23218.1 hypothetical protein CXQ85_002947 [[Candida] haemuloni]